MQLSSKQLSSKQLSLVTLGTFASLSAYGLVLARPPIDSEANTLTPQFSGQKLKQSDAKPQSKLVQPLAHSETITAHPLALRGPNSRPLRVNSTPSMAPVQLISQPVAKPGVPPSFTLKQSAARIRPIQVETLPINEWVAETLNPSSPTLPQRIALEPRKFTAVTVQPISTTAREQQAMAPSLSPLSNRSEAKEAVSVEVSTQPERQSRLSGERFQSSSVERSVAQAIAASTPSVAAPSLPDRSGIAKPETLPIVWGSKELTPEHSERGLNLNRDIYRLKPGDLVRVQISNLPESSQEYQVLDNGSLNLPGAGRLEVKGLTMQQVEELVSTKYAAVGTQAEVNVTLTVIAPDASKQSSEIAPLVFANSAPHSTR